MEELMKMVCIIPMFLILALGVAFLIIAFNALFIFANLCTRLTRRVLKIIAKRFEEKES
ncbi:MAG: hypothetical protein IJQ01_02565 [Selenomonadaceae bacterium]|nr:hypothetical protein [Selenomonadaceae bacterium]